MADRAADVSEAFLKATGPIVLVNLPYRVDRRAEFGTQLKAIGLSYGHSDVRVFDAIRPDSADGFPTLGARGCFLSHLQILRQARADGWDRVLICEDDLDFTDLALSRLPGITKALETTDWSMFYGGYRGSVSGEEVGAGVVRVDPAFEIPCAHFYAVRGPAIADLVTYLEGILSRPTGHPDGGLMHYDGALCWFRRARPQYATLAAVPEIGVQRRSRTDIHDLKWFDRWPGLRSLAALARRAGISRPKLPKT